MAGISSFAEQAVVAEQACIKVPDEVPLDVVCLIGCGVMTGVGAAINTAQVEPGSSAVVIGCGGVGLNVIQGCVLAGASTIIGVDLLDNKLDYALQFGATQTINPSRDELVRSVRKLTGGRGADYAFEVIGLSQTVEQAYACTRQAGTTIVVGAGSRRDTVSIPMGTFLTEKIIKGSGYGSARPHIDMPRLVEHYRNGRLKLKENDYPDLCPGGSERGHDRAGKGRSGAQRRGHVRHGGKEKEFQSVVEETSSDERSAG